jgi:hypothetical protein
VKVYPGSWPVTVVCGASGTGRTRFAYELAAQYNGHVIDTSDVLRAVRAMTGPEQYPELFTQEQPLAGTAEELAAARLRAADVLAPAVRAVMTEQPRLRLDGFHKYPHTVVTGRHALPTLAWDFAVILVETKDQIQANLAGRYPRDDSPDLRVRASMLVQDELLRRGREHNRTRCHVVFVDARPWSDAVDRARSEMSDRWDSSNALG